MRKDKISRFTAHPAAWQLAVTVAAVSGLFCLIVCVLLIANYLQIIAIDPLDLPVLMELRRQLADAPEADPALVQQVRALDLLARKAFFTSQAQLRIGGQLLLGGAVVFLIALKLAARWSPRLPIPPGNAPSERYWAHAAYVKEVLALVSIALVLIALTAAYLTPLDFPVAGNLAQVPSGAKETKTSLAFPEWEAIQRQWPSFRGPGGYGTAYYDTAPTDWDGATGKNVRWKTEVPLPGFSSPVVWDDAVFLTGATGDVREVYCFDASSGDLRWKRTVPQFPGTPDTPPKVSKDTGYAAPTMAVHGELTFAIFANGDLVCYDVSGNQRWGRNLGVPNNHYGHASSLIAFGELLFIQYDQKGAAKLIALEAATGEEAWIAQRSKISWASPIYVHTPLGVQLILNSEQDVDAYDPATGRLLWTIKCLDGEVAPSPAYAANTVFVANEYATASAIRLDTGAGETKPEILWQWDDSLPEVASPVGADRYFYIATSMGDIICLSIDEGVEVWRHEFDEGFYSSPIRVGDRIYVLNRAGVMQIFRTGEAFELIGAPALGEPAFATPAYLDGRMYVRTAKNLLCIEQQNDGHT